MIPDPLAALKTILGLDATIAGMVTTAPAGPRIFVGELPASESPNMPRTAVLIQPSGGLPERGFLQISHPRIDVRCYGETPNAAWRLSAAVHETLKNLQRRNAAASSSGIKALIHNVDPIGGAVQMREPTGDWPFTFRVYELLASEVPVP
jgi:hypothetical protein